MIRKILASKRAEGGYIDIIIGVIAVVMCLVAALSIFTVVFQKNTMDRIADELIEVAAYSGAFGEEYEKKLASIQEKYGDAYTVEFGVGDAGWHNSEYRQVQLGDEMKITVRRNTSLRRFDVANLGITLSTTRVAASEKYWKIEDGDYGTTNPDTPPSQSQYTYVIDVSTKVFHRTDCSLIASIPSVYRENTSKSYKTLLSEGYIPCDTCNPHNCVASEIEAFNTDSHWGYCPTCGQEASKTHHNFFNDGGVYKCVDCNYVQEYASFYCRHCHAPLAEGEIHYMDCRGYAVITFRANGGVFSPDNSTTNTVTLHLESGRAVYGTLKTPTNADTTFVGWYLDKEGFTAFDPTAVSGNVDVYACWGNVVQLTIDSENKYWPEIGYSDAQDVNLKIPSIFKKDDQWYEVVAIADSAFKNAPNLISVYIPDSVQTIGNYAFSQCKNLKTVRLPSGLTTINVAAFYVCGLTEIDIPATVTTIESHAFRGCMALTSVNLPEGITYIGWYAFDRCYQLNSLIIPSSVKTVDSYAFSFCRGLDAIAFRHKSGEDIDIKTNAFYASEFIATKLSTRNSAILEYNWLGDNRTFVCEDLTITQDNRQWIGFTDTTADLTIPEYTVSDNGTLYRITGIGREAFREVTALKRIVVPESVRTIGDGAFVDSSIETVVIEGEQLQTIGVSAFEYSALKSINLPNSLTTIENSAFQGAKLTGITLPSGLTSIGDCAFQECHQLQYVVIPSSVTRIGSDAFTDCPSLTDITFNHTAGDTVEIGATAFWVSTQVPTNLTTSLNDVANYDWAGDNRVLQAEEFTITDENRGDVGYTDSTKVLDIPAYFVKDGKMYKVVGIDVDAFSCCKQLETVTMPDTITYLGGYAFDDCSGLTSVKLSTGIKSIGDCAFQYCSSLTDIELHDGLNVIEPEAFYRCTSLSSITVPASVTDIGDIAFYGCTSLTTISFEHTDRDTISIGTEAFYVSKKLGTTFAINNDYIREYNWLGDNRVDASVVIDLVVNDTNRYWTEIGFTDDATELHIPATFVRNNIKYKVVGIDSNAFYECEQLGVITLPDTVTRIGNGAFMYTAITEMVLPESITYIGASAFECCTNLASINIPEGVTCLDWGVFADTALTSVEIPSAVTVINGYAFQNTNLTALTIPASVTHIGESAFGGCDNMETVIIESSDEELEIGSYAFEDVAITEIVFPARVSCIARYAFWGCDSLDTISFRHEREAIVDIGTNAFKVNSASLKQTTLITDCESVWTYDWAGDNRNVGTN